MLYKIAVSLVMWMLKHEESAGEERCRGNNSHEGRWDSGVGHEREARSRKTCVVDFAVLLTS